MGSAATRYSLGACRRACVAFAAYGQASQIGGPGEGGSLLGGGDRAPNGRTGEFRWQAFETQLQFVGSHLQSLSFNTPWFYLSLFHHALPHRNQDRLVADENIRHQTNCEWSILNE